MFNFCCGSKKKPKTSQVQPNINNSFIDPKYPNGQENYMMNVPLISNQNKKQIKRGAADRSVDIAAQKGDKSQMDESKEEDFSHAYADATK